MAHEQMTAVPAPVSTRLPWHRATNLRDRLDGGAPLQVDPVRAEKRLAMWLEVPSLAGDPDTLDERLAPLGVTRDELFALLGETDASLAARFAREPEWHRTFTRWWADGRGTPADHRLVPPELGLLEVARPLLEGALREFAARARQRLAREPGPPAALSATDDVVNRLIATVPIADLQNYLSRTMVLELNVARLEGRLAGDTPQARYASFVAMLADQDLALSLWREYVVLARCLVERLGFWITTRLELLEALLADLPSLVTGGLLPRPPRRLERVDFGAGDSHRGGRSVAILTFDTGQVVFKPRSLELDVAFDRLLAWVNDQGPRHPLRRMRILDRGEYGWIEFVDSEARTDAAGADRFAWRLGALTALLYLLHATDCHYENVIASGDDPVLVDLEALLHTDKSAAVVEIDGRRDVATMTLLNSVYSIGILPNQLLVRDAQQVLGLDMSALAGQGGQLSPVAVPTMEEVGTDTMHVVARRLEMPGERNFPTDADGTPIDLVSRSAFFQDGFGWAYACLHARRAALRTPDGPLAAFATARSRFILRATSVYARLLLESLHPDFLRDGLDRDRGLARLCTGLDGIDYKARVVQHELAELWRGDIPMFTVDADSGAVRATLTGAVIATRRQPPFAVVAARVEQLGDEDRAFQEWVIRSSIAAAAVGGGDLRWSQWRRPRMTGSASPDEFADEALRVARRLAELSLRDEHSVGWVGLNLVDERFWKLVPAASDTYTGVAGIAHALDAVAAVTGDAAVGDLAVRAFDQLADRVERLVRQLREQPAAERLPDIGIGAFSDLGGVIYTLSHAAVRHDRPDYVRAVVDLLPTIGALADEDTRLDVVAGAAGAILVLLALEHAAPGKGALDVARRCARRLLATRHDTGGGVGWLTALNPEAPLAGFSHGASGFAVALARLHQLRPDPAYLPVIEGCLQYESGVYDPAAGTWPDLRTASQGGGGPTLNAWCHGAAGIALARHELLRLDPLPDLRDELEADRHRGVLATAATGLVQDPVSGLGNHSLCHGDLGNLLILQRTHRLEREPEVAEVLPAVWRTLLTEGRTEGWLCGVPRGIETPGLMTGIAGVAWGLARMAAPDRVPDVLLLEPPRPTGGER